MNEVISTISGPVLLGVFAALWGIIFLVVWQVLRENGLFGKRIAAAVAMCVSLLAVVGIYQIFFAAKAGKDASGSSGQTGVGLVLLPYTVLGIAILVLLLLVFLTKLARGYERKNLPTDVLKRTESSFQSKYQEERLASVNRQKKRYANPGRETRMARGRQTRTQVNSDRIRQIETNVKTNDVQRSCNQDK